MLLRYALLYSNPVRWPALVIRCQVDPDRRAVRPKDRKPRGSLRAPALGDRWPHGFSTQCELREHFTWFALLTRSSRTCPASFDRDFLQNDCLLSSDREPATGSVITHRRNHARSQIPTRSETCAEPWEPRDHRHCGALLKSSFEDRGWACVRRVAYAANTAMAPPCVGHRR